jgi:hypothetical protein
MSSMTDVVMQMMMGASPQAGMGAANLPDLLATLAQRDPRMAPLVQQMQARLAARNNEAEAAAEEETIPEPEILEPAKPPEQGRKLKKLAKTMFTELQALRKRNDTLADALGACHLCWGEDRACVYCAGEGQVGAFLIDVKTFEDVIGPAVQQVTQRPPLAKPQTTNKGEANHAGLRVG